MRETCVDKSACDALLFLSRSIRLLSDACEQSNFKQNRFYPN